MREIYRYISNNYHTFAMESRGMYSINYEILAKEICNIVSDFFKTHSSLLSEIPELIFINTVERKSKYIVEYDEHYILLDLHQVMEYVWGSQVASFIDGDILSVISGATGGDKENIEIGMALFLYSSDQNILKARICNCFNLADLCFSKGYVDAAIKNLCSVITMREDINDNNLADMIFSEQLLYEAKIIGGFIYLHELTHHFFERNKKHLSGIGDIKRLINLIRLRYESGVLSKEWRKYACKYSSDNYIVNLEISDLFCKMKINTKYPRLFEQLENHALSWKNMNFESDDWELFSEELICDIIALNAIISIEKANHYIISYIVRALLIQETFSLQDNLLMCLTGRQKEINLKNIKRVQLIFAALVVDYQECENHQGWNSIISYVNYGKEKFDDLLIDICNSVEVIHENFYLVAVQDLFKSLLSEDVLHKHINCAYFLEAGSKKFVFTDDYSGKKNTNKKRMTDIDSILLQKELIKEYEKFIQYVFE